MSLAYCDEVENFPFPVVYRIPPDLEPEPPPPPKADLNSGRREAMEEQMMATLSSI
jgi:hypothetical protein